MGRKRKTKKALDGVGTTLNMLAAAGRVDAANAAAQAADDHNSPPKGERGGSSSSSSDGGLKRPRPDDDDDGDKDATAGDQWEVVGRQAKKRKKKDKYPELVWSDRSRLTSKIKITDVRDLVLYVQADGVAPQWVSVSHRANIRKMVVVMVPGLENAMFDGEVDLAGYNAVDRVPDAGQPQDPQDNYPRALTRAGLPRVLEPWADMFSHLWPVRAPGDDRCLRMYSPAGHFLAAPAPKHREKGGKIPGAKEPNGWKNVPARISELLATRDELAEHGIGLHPALYRVAAEGPAGEDDDKAPAAPELPAGWVATRVHSLEEGDVPEDEIEQGSMTGGRQVLAVDCEMCLTDPDEYSLTRISILDWGGDVVMDELVKPDKPITDYLTQYSGITAEMLAPVTTTLADVQKKLLDLVTPRTVLVGHSIDSDLKAMRLAHPFIADTSLLYPHPRGPPLKQSLRYLTQKYLGREIQKGHGAGGHNSVEDARASLDLVRQKCEKGKLWGVLDVQGESLFRRLGRAGVSMEQAANAAAAATAAATTTTTTTTAGDGVAAASQQQPELGKKSAAIEMGDVARGPGAQATYRISCKSDDDVVRGIARAVQGDADGAEIPFGGVDFVWARMRELEAHQGWLKHASSYDDARPGHRNNAARNRAASQNNSNSNSNGGAAAAESLALDDASDTAAAPLLRSRLEEHLAATTARLVAIHASLPPCTALLVLSGSGDPREMARLQDLQIVAKREAESGVKWEDLSVRWTSEHDDALVRAVKYARAGIGFFGIK